MTIEEVKENIITLVSIAEDHTEPEEFKQLDEAGVIALDALNQLEMFRSGKLSLVHTDSYIKLCKENDSYKLAGTPEECQRATAKENRFIACLCATVMGVCLIPIVTIATLAVLMELGIDVRWFMK